MTFDVMATMINTLLRLVNGCGCALKIKNKTENFDTGLSSADFLLYSCHAICPSAATGLYYWNVNIFHRGALGETNHSFSLVSIVTCALTFFLQRVSVLMPELFTTSLIIRRLFGSRPIGLNCSNDAISTITLVSTMSPRENETMVKSSTKKTQVVINQHKPSICQQCLSLL